MKRLLLALVMVGVMFGIGNAELKKEMQKFKVSYTITFNEITLEEAQKKEAVIREMFKTACDLGINICGFFPG